MEMIVCGTFSCILFFSNSDITERQTTAAEAARSKLTVLESNSPMLCHQGLTDSVPRKCSGPKKG